LVTRTGDDGRCQFVGQHLVLGVILKDTVGEHGAVTADGGAVPAVDAALQEFLLKDRATS